MTKGVDISIHALVKRATRNRYNTAYVTAHFNPRPREEGDYFKSSRYIIIKYFNPRPREEGDALYQAETFSRFISIHALVKRATYAEYEDYERCNISIHALVKRATQLYIFRQRS